MTDFAQIWPSFSHPSIGRSERGGKCAIYAAPEMVKYQNGALLMVINYQYQKYLENGKRFITMTEMGYHGGPLRGLTGGSETPL